MAKKLKNRKKQGKISLMIWLCIMLSIDITAAIIVILFINLAVLDSIKSSLVEIRYENGHMINLVENSGFYNFIEFLQTLMPVTIAAASVFVTAVIFYRFKLKKPIDALTDGINHIELQDLDFKIDCRSEDELGALCRAFDSMRIKLKETFLSLWNEQEKKILLTRALAHDLRTPLSVLKGHNDLMRISLQSGEADKAELSEMVDVIGENISRMECYLDNVREIHSLEDWELNVQNISLQEISSNILSMNILRSEITLEVTAQEDYSANIDKSLVMRVVENLMKNAVEYAVHTVKVSVEISENTLHICVADDGKGFSPDALFQAAEPFYRGDSSRGSHHTGLGLSIAKIMAEKHGGGIEWGNNATGAYVKVFFKSLDFV
jgi:signal transduction histidine kinase